MSVYIANSSEVLGQFASNFGYKELRDAAQAFRELNALFENGVTEEVDEVQTELVLLIKYSKNEDVVSCAKELNKLLKGQDCVVVTDGTSGDVNKSADEDVSKSNGNGVMIAFKIPEDLAETLVVGHEGAEDADQLHLTLAYLGKYDQIDHALIAGLKSCLQNFGMNYAAISGTLGGPQRFNATTFSDDKDVCVASFQCKGIQGFRKELLDYIEFAGFQAKNNFEYTPHITLAFIDPEEDLPVHRIPPQDITFHSITLYFGGEQFDYPLLGTNVAKAESESAPVEDDRYSEDDESESEDQEDYESCELSSTIIKLDNDKQLAFGWFSVVEVDGRPVEDTQGDIITPETLEASCYEFVLTARKGGHMHESLDTGEVRGIGRLVESVVFTKEKVEAMLSSLHAQGIQAEINLHCICWWGGFRIDDLEVWKKIKTGELRAFSIGGRGKRAQL